MYNKEDYVKRSVESVLSQTHSDFELLIVDDGSTDDSLSKLREINDDRLTIIEVKNNGVSKARNLGVEASRYEWVFLLDADDEFKKDHLKNLVTMIHQYENSNLSIVGSNYSCVTANNEEINGAHFDGGLQSFFKLFRHLRTPVNSSSVGLRKCYFNECGGFDESQKHYEDWTLYLKMALLGGFAYTDKVTSIYHLESSGASKVENTRALSADAMTLLNGVQEFTISSKVGEKALKEATACLDDLCMHLSYLFAKERERVQAIKFLRKVENWNVFTESGTPLLLMKIIVLLILPSWVVDRLRGGQRA